MSLIPQQSSRLRFKIIASLLLVLSISMGSALFGLWTYQRDHLLSIYHEKAKRAGQAIVASLWQSMLHNDKEAIRKSFQEMAAVDPLVTMSLINKRGEIIHSSDVASVGRIFDKEENETCKACHDKPTLPMSDTVVFQSSANNPQLRTVIPIKNRPDCYGCHPASQKLNGILVVDDSLTQTYVILKTVTKRIIYTGIITFLIIFVLVSYIVTRFVSSPMKAFMQGIKQVEDGDYKTWIDVHGSAEFDEMADSFNVMIQALGRYIEEIEGKTKEINTLYTIVKRMSETIDLKKIKNILVDLLFEILNAEGVVLCLPVEKHDGLFEITWKKEGDKRHYHENFSLDSLEFPYQFFHRYELENWVQKKYKTPLFFENDNRVLIPLKFKEIQLGLICAAKEKDKKFLSAEKRILPDLTKHIAVSFANARLYNLATTDDLTTLYTKGFLEARIKEFVETFFRTNESFSVMMVDIDHFKEVNDTHGHPIGDVVLQKIAELIRDNLRHIDICCRYGGEEFVVLLPGEKIRSASIIANRLREKVARHVFELKNVPEFSKTISIGISNCPLHATTWKELIEMADSAMYEAKQNGRNKVYFEKFEVT